MTERLIYIKRSKTPTVEERRRWIVQEEIDQLVQVKKRLCSDRWEAINVRILELNKEYFQLGGLADLQW